MHTRCTHVHTSTHRRTRTLFIDISDQGNVKLRDLQSYLDLACALFQLCPVGGSMCSGVCVPFFHCMFEKILVLFIKIYTENRLHPIVQILDTRQTIEE